MALGDNWDEEPNGNVKARPLMGWQTARMPPVGLLRLEYAEKLADLDANTPSALQVHMTASQARELAAALLRMADNLAPPDRSQMQ